MFLESQIFLHDENLRIFNLDLKNNTLFQNHLPEFKVNQVSYRRPPILIFRSNFDNLTWVRFHSDVV